VAYAESNREYERSAAVSREALTAGTPSAVEQAKTRMSGAKNATQEARFAYHQHRMTHTGDLKKHA
jgi:hypothetical protein